MRDIHDILSDMYVAMADLTEWSVANGLIPAEGFRRTRSARGDAARALHASGFSERQIAEF
jgi:hypothetical protein